MKFEPLQIFKNFNFCPALSERALDQYFEMCVCLSVCLCVCLCVTNFQASDWWKYGDVARRRKTLCDVARLHLMVQLEPWQNSTPFFGAAAICTTKIDDFRASLLLTSLMSWSNHSSKRRSLRWTSSKGQIMEVVEVDHVEETMRSMRWIRD